MEENFAKSRIERMEKLGFFKKGNNEWTDEELASKLKEVFDKNTAVIVSPSGREINDNEGMHCDADQLLEDFLRAIGYNKSADQYEEMSNYFWYA